MYLSTSKDETHQKMPPKPTKKGKQTKKGAAEDADTDKVPGMSLESVGVKECLVWDRRTRGRGASAQSQAQQPEDSEREHKFLVKKGELGKPADRGYVYPEEHTNKDHEDEGTAMEALRGWPNSQREREEEQERLAEAQQEQQQHQEKPASGKKGKEDPKADPPMVYLVAHKYLNDFERKKMEEAEAERQKELAKKKPVDFAALCEMKGNKTSQLRSIHLAGQKQVDPKDLWKMKKFTNAKSSLDTRRKGEKSKKGQTGGTKTGGGDCTCGLNMNETNRDRQEQPQTGGYDYSYVPFEGYEGYQQKSPEFAY